MAFLDKNYLLENEIAKKLYKKIEGLPILDPHNHGDVKEIVENEPWNDIWEIEAETDHYVWELMRKRGVEENKITGSASNKEKWLALAKIFPELAGNPSYEWIHLDLKRRFGINELISEATAESIWKKTKEALKKKEMRPQKLLKEMQVEIMCTTDEPFSRLEYHKKAEKIESIKILPTWRPDKIKNIEAKNWKKYLDKLGAAYDQDVADLDGLMKALKKSHDYFAEMGCAASDHGIPKPVSYQVEKSDADVIYKKALAGNKLSQKEINDFKAFMLIEFGKLNQEKGWVTQLHIGAVRDYRESLYNDLGADAGGDISTNEIEITDNLKYFFNYFDSNLDIVLYTMESTHWFSIASISRAFPNIYLGAPWWLNDSPQGMKEFLQEVSNIDLFYNLAGMVTDSRKLMSYSSRTEMFRRTLANVLGHQVETGRIPESAAFNLAAHLSYEGPKELFFS